MNRRFPRFLQILFFFLLAGVFLRFDSAHAADTKPAPAPAADISARLEAATGTITIGEPLPCRLIIKYSKDVEILSKLGEAEARGLEIKDMKDFTDREGKFQIVGQTFTLKGYQLGEYMLEPLEVSYRKKGGAVQTIKSNPLFIKVKSIAEGEEKTDIRDVKGVVKLPYKILKYLLPIGIPALLLALLASYLLHFRKKELEKNRSALKLSPADQAVRDLHELFDSALIRDGQTKQYYLRFSEILRIFLEKQFGIQATEATTSEIAILCKRLFLLEEDTKVRLIQILTAADYAKFAKWVPPPADITALNRQAEAIVRELAAPHPLRVNQNAVS